MDKSVPLWPKKQNRSEARKREDRQRQNKNKNNKGAWTANTRWKDLMMEEILSRDAEVLLDR